MEERRLISWSFPCLYVRLAPHRVASQELAAAFTARRQFIDAGCYLHRRTAVINFKPAITAAGVDRLHLGPAWYFRRRLPFRADAVTLPGESFGIHDAI